MVWGMPEPMSFGDFYPDGEFVGRRERLTEHFDQMTEAEKVGFGRFGVNEYHSMVIRKFSAEIGVTVGSRPPLTPIEPHEWPVEFRTIKSYKHLGDFISLAGTMTVSVPMKDLLERIDPGVHQFHPVRITMPRGVDYPEPYFTLVIGRFLDAFVPEKSDAGAWEKSTLTDHYHSVGSGKKSIEGIALSADATAGAHLWRDRKLRAPEMYLSDVLHEAAAEAGLRLPKHFKMKSV